MYISDEGYLSGVRPEIGQQSSQWMDPSWPQRKKVRHVKNGVNSTLLRVNNERIFRRQFFPPVRCSFKTDTKCSEAFLGRCETKSSAKASFTAFPDPTRHEPAHILCFHATIFSPNRIITFFYFSHLITSIPSNLFLFDQMINRHQSRWCAGLTGVPEKSQTGLDNITWPELHECFHQWKRRGNLAIYSQELYFKGDTNE